MEPEEVSAGVRGHVTRLDSHGAALANRERKEKATPVASPKGLQRIPSAAPGGGTNGDGSPNRKSPGPSSAPCSPPRHLAVGSQSFNVHKRPLAEQTQQMSREFSVLQRMEEQYKVNFTTSSQNMRNNRYLDVLANEETLFPSTGSEIFRRYVADGFSDPSGVGVGCYLNANTIDLGTPHTFVASQAPLPHMISYFFEAILEEKVSLVIMLTSEFEGGLQKAHSYWPDPHQGNGGFGYNDEGLLDRESTSGSGSGKTFSFLCSGAETKTTKGSSSIDVGRNICVTCDPDAPYEYDEKLSLIRRPLIITRTTGPQQNGGKSGSDSSVRSSGSSEHSVGGAERKGSSSDLKARTPAAKSDRSPSPSSDKGSSPLAGSKRAKHSRKASTEVHKVLVIQYTGWPDHGVPSSSDSFKALLHIVRQQPMRPSKPSTAESGKSANGSAAKDTSGQGASASDARCSTQKQELLAQEGVDLGPTQKDSGVHTPPILVHCSAGIGRTGTLIAAYKAAWALENNNLTNRTIFDTVAEMRKMRSRMVQRVEQYMFVYMFVMSLLPGVDVKPFSASLNELATKFQVQQRIARMNRV